MTVVDPLTDEEISDETDDGVMTCWVVGWTATVVVSISGVRSFVTIEDDLVDTLTEDGRRETLVSIPCIVLLAAAAILGVALVDGTMVAVLAQEVLTACIVVTILVDIEGEGNTKLK